MLSGCRSVCPLSVRASVVRKHLYRVTRYIFTWWNDFNEILQTYSSREWARCIAVKVFKVAGSEVKVRQRRPYGNLVHSELKITLPVHFTCTRTVPRSTQPGQPFVGRRNEYTSQRAMTPCGWGVKAGMVCVWVARVYPSALL